MNARVNYKRLGFKAILFGTVLISYQAQAFDIHLNVNVGTPAYWGEVPVVVSAPNLWNASPIVQLGTALATGSPIYLTVPDLERKNWGKYCDRYHACSRPVYFVKRGWYDKHYNKHDEKHYRKHHKHHDDDDD